MNFVAEFAIVVCTYNPNPLLLERLLSAIQSILTNTQSVEVLLVDNNSSPPLDTLASVQAFLAANSQVRCSVECKQGLAFARCHAAQETTAPFVIFFDDDNEPSCDYLQILNSYFNQYPNVGIWGPGQIIVEYVDPVEPWFYQHPESFQQRQVEFGYTCVPATLGPYFPNGTGFAIRREILLQYASAVDQGTLQITGRKGKSLSSAEDSQIAWESIKMGFAVGMIPELQCKHLITADKANFAYLKRLYFNTASSFVLALEESFPQQVVKWDAPLTMVQAYIHLIKYLVVMLLLPQHRVETQLHLAKVLGGWYGQALVLQSPHIQQFRLLAERFQLI